MRCVTVTEREIETPSVAAKGESRAPPQTTVPSIYSTSTLSLSFTTLNPFLAIIHTMDDEIQFIGMVSPVSTQKPSYAHPNNPPTMQPPASGASLAVQSDETHSAVLTYNPIGIMLVIPKSGEEPTQTLRFLKSRSAVVHIGRASSSVVDPDKSPDSVQFRCPVISRRHAKLMFSSGHVCLFPPLPFLSPLNVHPSFDSLDLSHIRRFTSSIYIPIMELIS